MTIKQGKMNILDRVINWFSPRKGCERANARLRLSMMNRTYEGASISKKIGNLSAFNRVDENNIWGKQGALLRERARDLGRNNCYAVSITQSLITNFVGYGIKPSFRCEDKEKRDLIKTLWKEWGESKLCDIRNKSSFYAIQEQVVKYLVESGECLIRKVVKQSNKENKFSFALQVISPEFLDSKEDDGKDIRLGVKLNKFGAPLGYYLLKDLSYDYLNRENVFVDANEIIHIFNSPSPDSVRGIPLFAPIITKLNDLSMFESAELSKQALSSCFAGFLKDFNDDSVNEEEKQKAILEDMGEIEPGRIQYLPSNKELVFSNPPQYSNYDVYAKSTLLSVAAAVGISYEDVSGDYGRVTFLNGRMSRMRTHAFAERWQWNVIIPQLCEPVMSWFLTELKLLGIDTSDVSVSWTPPRKVWLDPRTEIAAKKEEIRIGLCTPAEAVREYGLNYDELLDEYQECNEELDKRGLVFDSDPRKIGGSGQAQADKTKDEEVEIKEEVEIED